MVAGINWHDLSGEKVERLIAVYICMKRPDAVAIRPSRGDKGMDLMCPGNMNEPVDIYQIKKFCTNLTGGQKKQIQESWDVLLKYAQQKKLNIKKWYIVMPLNPTPENIEELSKYTANSGITVRPLGLDKINSWAAEFPQVEDYFLNGGREYIHGREVEILRAATKPNITDSVSLYQHFTELQKAINSRNPNFEYDVHLLRPSENEMSIDSIPDGAVYATSYKNADGTSIQVVVFPRYKLAPLLDPIPGQVEFSLEGADGDQVVDFIKYGTPFQDVPGKISIPNSPFWESDSNQADSEGLISFLPSRTYQKNARYHFLSTLNDSAIAIREKSRNAGIEGAYWEGVDESGIITVTEKYAFKTAADSELPTLNTTVNYQLAKADGNRLDLVQRALNFLVDLYRGGRLNYQDQDNKQILSTNCKRNEEVANHLSTVSHIVSNLITCEKAATHSILCPNLTTNSKNDVDQWHLAAELLQHGWHLSKWDSFDMARDNASNDSNETEPSITFPAGCFIIQKLQIKVGASTYTLGHYASFMNVGSKERIGTTFKFRPPAGDDWSISLLMKSNVETSQLNRVYFGPKFEKEELRAQVASQSRGTGSEYENNVRGPYLQDGI